MIIICLFSNVSFTLTYQTFQKKMLSSWGYNCLPCQYLPEVRDSFVFLWLHQKPCNIKFAILTTLKCIWLSSTNYIHTGVQSISRTFLHWKTNSIATEHHVFILSVSMPPLALDNHHSAGVSLFLTTLHPHMSEIIQYLSFFDRLISFSIMFSRFIHVVVCDRNSFFRTE